MAGVSQRLFLEGSKHVQDAFVVNIFFCTHVLPLNASVVITQCKSVVRLLYLPPNLYRVACPQSQRSAPQGWHADANSGD